MKRSTTPAFRQNPNLTKSTANLKSSNHLKIITKETKRIISSSRSKNSNLTIHQKQQQSSFKKKTPKPLNNYNSTTQKSYEKYLDSSRKYNPECLESHDSPTKLKIPSHQIKLTDYLISKTWQNSSIILSNHVNPQMKKVVIQWLIQLSHYLKLKRQTLYHTLWIFERCIQKIADLNAKNLQLLAITCVFISAKYEEIYPPHVYVLLQKTMNSYPKSQVIELQQKILLCLNFQLTAPNRYTFLNLVTNSNTYLVQYDNQKPQNSLSTLSLPSNQKRYIDFCHYILELTLFKSFNQNYSQKQIADSVIYLSNKVMKKSNNFINQDDWLYLTKIQEIAYEIIQIWKENKNSIVSYLYDCDKYSFVGGLNIIY